MTATTTTISTVHPLRCTGARPVWLSPVASHLGREIGGDRRHTETVADIFTEEAAKLQLEGLDAPGLRRLADLVVEQIYRIVHSVGDCRSLIHETHVATQACRRVLSEEIGDQVWISDTWLGGEMVTTTTRGQVETFELTGDQCPRCSGPEAYGIGGGVRCVDTVGCGWWFCL